MIIISDVACYLFIYFSVVGVVVVATAPVMARATGKALPSESQVEDRPDSAAVRELQDAPNVEKAPLPAAVSKQSRRVVAINAQKLCSQCHKFPTPNTCTACGIPVCRECKVLYNGVGVGKYCQYGTSEMAHSHIVNGIETYNRLQSLSEQSGVTTRRRSEMLNRVLDPYRNSNAIATMLEASRLEDPMLSPCPSESEEDDPDKYVDGANTIDNFFDYTTHIDRVKVANPHMQDEDPLLVSDDDKECLGNVDDIEGLEWEPNKTLKPRAGKTLPTSSTIKPEYIESRFETPVSSFLAFLPTRMWEKICYETNTNAHEKMQRSGRRYISGNFWRKDVDVQEIMQFMGVAPSNDPSATTW